MAQKHEGAFRGFHHHSSAWYFKASKAKDEIDSFNIGMYYDEGGTSGEFSVVWTELGGKSVPQLHVFDDAWDALWHFRDLLEKMSKVDGKNISPQEFWKLLNSCGIRDITARDDPHATKKVLTRMNNARKL